MESWLYRWLPIIFGCHCRPDRSFFYKGKQFPICARCTGELVGILGTAVLGWFWLPSPWLSAVILIPMLVDGFLQALSSYESGNGRRLVTGILFGVGLASLLAHSTWAAVTFGIGIGRSLV